jgi:hypothetical protein
MNILDHLLADQKGSTLIAALVGLTLLGVTSASVIDLTTDESSGIINDFQKDQALYVGQAGLEDAKNRLNESLDPTVARKNFGSGYYSIASYPESKMVVVTSHVDKAIVTQTISFTKGSAAFIGDTPSDTPSTGNGNFASNCMNVDVSGANLYQNQLRGVKLDKVCNDTVNLSEMIVDWDVGTCDTPPANPAASPVVKVTGKQNDYTQWKDPGNSKKVLICHVPPGDPANAHTLSVAISGWENGHDAGVHTSTNHNQDYLGSCEDIKTSPPPENSPLANCVAKFHNTEHNHNAMHVDKIALANATLYDDSTGVGLPVTGANPEELITLEEDSMQTNTAYEFIGPHYAIAFDKTLPATVYFNLVFTFSDGSSKKTYFIVDGNGATVVDPPPSASSGSGSGAVQGGQVKILLN